MTIADLLLEIPPTSAGIPSGQGDWRVVVELLAVDSSPPVALWDIGRWDVERWGSSEIGWIDITDRVRGMEWRRGSDEVYGRPRVGEIAVTLDDTDGLLDPWTSPALAQYLGPGTLMRCGLRSAVGISSPSTGTVRWIPQWTGLVDTWAPQWTSTGGNDRFVEVTLNETLRDLAQVETAPISPVGANEGAAVRATRLLSAASWRYGYLLEAQNLIEFPATNYQLSATTMIQNRLAELYLTADSSDTSFRSLRDGRAALTAVEYQGAVSSVDRHAFPLVAASWFRSALARQLPFYTLGRTDTVSSTVSGQPAHFLTIAYRPETFRSVADDADLANSVRLQSFAGGSGSFEQLDSIARVGMRSYNRTDLVLASPASDHLLDQLAQFYSVRRGLNTLRLDAVTVDTWARPLAQFLAVVSIEPTDRGRVRHPIADEGYIDGLTASIVHKVAPRVSGSSVVWTTSIRLDTRLVVGIPGAQFPETPPT